MGLFSESVLGGSELCYLRVWDEFRLGLRHRQVVSETVKLHAFQPCLIQLSILLFLELGWWEGFSCAHQTTLMVETQHHNVCLCEVQQGMDHFRVKFRHSGLEESKSPFQM